MWYCIPAVNPFKQCSNCEGQTEMQSCRVTMCIPTFTHCFLGFMPCSENWPKFVLHLFVVTLVQKRTHNVGCSSEGGLGS